MKLEKKSKCLLFKNVEEKVITLTDEEKKEGRKEVQCFTNITFKRQKDN